MVHLDKCPSRYTTLPALAQLSLDEVAMAATRNIEAKKNPIIGMSFTTR